MRRLRYHLVDVFTDRPFGGNQLAVFTNGRGVPAGTMQSIAKELNLSESTFVLPPEDPGNDYRVRIFTPAVELPMAGHPTIGTAFVLAVEGMAGRGEGVTSLRLEEGVGTIPVAVAWGHGGPAKIEMRQPLPTFGPSFADARVIAEMLSLEARDITDTGLPMEAVSCGVPFLFVPLRDLEAVINIRFRIDVWEKTLRHYEAPHVFAFTKETVVEGSTVHSRAFAPASGIGEDAATGGASGPLGCYLVRHGVFPSARVFECVSEQGMEMGRPSFIQIRIEHDGGEIRGVSVGGRCHLMGEGFFEMPDDLLCT